MRCRLRPGRKREFGDWTVLGNGPQSVPGAPRIMVFEIFSRRLRRLDIFLSCRLLWSNRAGAHHPTAPRIRSFSDPLSISWKGKAMVAGKLLRKKQCDFEDGARYDGGWERGVFHGEGTLTWGRLDPGPMVIHIIGHNETLSGTRGLMAMAPRAHLPKTHETGRLLLYYTEYRLYSRTSLSFLSSTIDMHSLHIFQGNTVTQQVSGRGQSTTSHILWTIQFMPSGAVFSVCCCVLTSGSSWLRTWAGSSLHRFIRSPGWLFEYHGALRLSCCMHAPKICPPNNHF